ncbi:MAG: hypothetical protein GWN18_08725, partial [Thermoplasmata archaeon]|nr:hypothetical protein [Thermoplasmata archaeon]NIS12125.1 hypothetical protein [Thermoplasmata archaeon]NIS20050.1 hypothetical protein [Thermoplasmata archaeon]NIT77250.1 hypothetical protein [Thermoplasmata archaeon]NIU49152.1 hypothetical protein [Thermoplasmata archaeon]
EGSHLNIANSSLGTYGTLQVTDGTMTLVNCTHGYLGQVFGDGSWIREYVNVTINASRWACGPAIEGGQVDIVDANGTTIASKPHSEAREVEVMRWQVTPDGATTFRKARGSFWSEGWEFGTAPFDLVEGAFIELEFEDDFVPNITIEQPSDGETIQGTAVDLAGGFVEVGAGVAFVRARLDEGSWVNATFGENGRWNVTLAVSEDGVYMLTVAIEDLAGNVGTATVEVTTDDSGPFIEVLEPAPWVNIPDVDLVARTEPGARAWVNDVEVDVLGDGTFRRAVHLTGGVEVVRIRAMDPSGNWREKTYSIELDQTPPVIAIDEPTDGVWHGSTEVHVSGLVEDGATIMVNGVEPERDGVTWWIDLTSEEGNLDITAIAEDRAGNLATLDVLVHIDLSPPSLQVVSPADGSLLDTNSVNVTGFVVDLAPVTVTVNGQVAAVEDQDWHCL